MGRTPKLLPLEFLALCAGAALFVLSPALAQQPGRAAPMPGMTPAAATSPLMQAMDKMDKDMAAAPQTGNTDQDFVAMMIPHHQGAIDMAKVELAQGKDPVVRRLAHNIIAAQQREIKEMKEWQTKHPAKAE